MDKKSSKCSFEDNRHSNAGDRLLSKIVSRRISTNEFDRIDIFSPPVEQSDRRSNWNTTGLGGLSA